MEEKAKRGRGRPPKWETDPDVKERIAAAYAVSGSFDYACDVGGVSRQTGRTWREKDEKFLEACTRARAMAAHSAIKLLLERDPLRWLQCYAPDELKPPKDEQESGTFTYKHIVGGAVVEEQVFTRETAQDATPEPEVKE